MERRRTPVDANTSRLLLKDDAIVMMHCIGGGQNDIVLPLLVVHN